ncbi:cleavage stimulation factor subunit 2-like [Littorina saxatilis]|uniref:RRM domain-containing protein n=1 Tax=Littorina saxatilis TaxID=31220 RepID=A0AAN9GGW1_9CAEN
MAFAQLTAGLIGQSMSNMSGNSGALPPATATERASRSVFVGNIPYDATEEQLKEIFNQVGQVVSFRLVYDRETGKPKGYGFCEYADQETAQSAMRNLNNYDFSGRPLRVGYAAGETSKDEMKGMQQAVGGMVLESPFGDPVEPEKAPEAISKAVASLPPEQMFELMKQMKLCIQNNPNEARNMLLQNPQLAFALLQAQIVMKIVDPQVAMAMLYRDDALPPANFPPVPAPTMVPPPAAVPNRPPVPSVSATLGRMFPGPPPVTVAASGPSQPPPRAIPLPAAPLMPLPEMPSRDPRMAPGAPGPVRPPPQMQAPSAPAPGGQDPQISVQDQEKAALIMQVLQLTDQQIAMLPPEQRQSILILKDQLSKNQ